MSKFKFRNFRTGFHAPSEDEIVLHAIHNLLGLKYNRIMVGISADEVSLRICKVLRRYGIIKSPTSDLGMCSYLLQDLIDYLSSNGILSIRQIEDECLKVAVEYPEDSVPPMNLNLPAS